MERKGKGRAPSNGKGTTSKSIAKTYGVEIIEDNEEGEEIINFKRKTAYEEVLLSVMNLSGAYKAMLHSYLTKELEKEIDIDIELFQMVLREAGERPISLVSFANSELGTLWRRNQGAFQKVVDDFIAGGTYRKTHILGLKRLLIGILLDNLRSSNMPLNMRNICVALGYFGNTIDAALPNYRANQLGPLIMNRLKGSENG